MDNNDPCWISVANSGVLIKKSKIGLFGTKVYEKHIADSANAAYALSKRYRNVLTPPEMRHPLLKAFTNAVLHCTSLEEAKSVLNEEFPEPDLTELATFLRSGAK